MGQTFTFVSKQAGWDDPDDIVLDAVYVIDRDGGILDPDLEERLDETDWRQGRFITEETYVNVSELVLAIEVIERRDGTISWNILLHPRPQSDQQLLVLSAISDTFGLRPNPFGWGFREAGEVKK